MVVWDQQELKMMDFLFHLTTYLATYSAWLMFGGVMFFVGFFCGGFMMRLTGKHLK